LPNKERIPQGVWPVQLVASLPPGEGGFHLTKRNQPFAKVILSPDSLEWTVDASHEILEMLVDSAGNRLQASEAIRIADNGVGVEDAPGKFEYLVEVCDPCEADNYTYQIDGFAVSDFITPHFYDPPGTQDARYSFTGAIERARQLLPGGYISFVNPDEDLMQQVLWVDPSKAPELRNLGPASGASLREFVETRTRDLSHKHRAAQRAKTDVAARHQRYREKLAAAAAVRAKYYY
jgi:hypothetical protein